MIGAKAGLWLVGSELSFPSFFALAYTAGSSPPKNQYTAGTSHPAPKQPKSSLAIVGFVCSMEQIGRASCRERVYIWVDAVAVEKKDDNCRAIESAVHVGVSLRKRDRACLRAR